MSKMVCGNCRSFVDHPPQPLDLPDPTVVRELHVKPLGLGV
jgi:hypothetical protein